MTIGRIKHLRAVSVNGGVGLSFFRAPRYYRAMTVTTLRPLQADYAATLAQVIYESIWQGTAEHYSEAQRRAWAGDAPNPKGWRKKLERMEGIVALQGGTAVGFMTLDAAGLIDLAFVSPIASRQGVGRKLYDAIEQKARCLGVSILTTHASKAAHPFFQGLGWSVLAEQTVFRAGVALTNYKMSKRL